MNRFAVHLALWTRDWRDDVLPFARRACALGYDGVEISLLGAAAEMPEQMGRAIADLGLSVTTTYGLSADEDIGSTDPAIRRKGVAKLGQCIRAARSLGADLLSGVLYAPWQSFEPRRKVERIELAAAGLRALAPLAGDLGVSLGVEAINRFETDLVTTAAEARSLAEAVGSPNVGVLLDSFHMNIEEVDPAAAIRSVGRHLVHYHCVDNDRGVPGGGSIDFAAQASALSEIGFSGWITTEMFILPDVEVSRDLSIWRAIETDPDHAARDALAFMKKTF